MSQFRFTISKKIGVGFGLFILVVTFVFLMTNNTLNKSREINRRINEDYAPSLKVLGELDTRLLRSQDLARQWTFVQRIEGHHERQEFVSLTDSIIPRQLSLIKERSATWPEDEKQNADRLINDVTSLVVYYNSIKRLLPDFDSYSDPIRAMMAEDYFLEGTNIPLIYADIRSNLDDLISRQNERMANEINKMNESFSALRGMLVNIAILIIVAGIVIAILTTRAIIRPVNTLRHKLTNLSMGIYSLHPTRAGNDEIGDMANAVNRLITNFEKTKEFSLNVGAGHFDVEYAPLSEHDELGKALIKMRDDLASYHREMESRVSRQTQEIRQNKEEVELQKERLSELYHDLKSSIDYAQRLQKTILPDDSIIQEMFPESFVFFRPKATVSGDFYWFKSQGGKQIFVAADCTGHGVPGAFMSLVGHNMLSQVTKVFTKPSQILNNVNRLAAEVMRSDDGNDYLRDGMDITLCSFDPKTLMLEFSGAQNPIYIIRNNEIIEIEGDSFSIGSYTNGEKEFTNHTFQLEAQDCIYMFSDGYADQFGGPRNKKFLRKQFRMLLLSIYHLPMHEQKERLENALDSWKGEHEQVDDILVMGVRIL